MASHHEPLKTLGPIEWEDVMRQDVRVFMNTTFGQAQLVIDSIPSAVTSGKSAPSGRARAKTDSAVVHNNQASPSRSSHKSVDLAALSTQLQKEWKQVKTNPKENPLDISVYKLSSKDGKGAWFARRSVHGGLTFDQWKAGLQREFQESLKVKGAPGSGNIRGIGADRNVEHRVVDGAGHLDVFQLSAQFPGPTAPRDFITLLLTSDLSHVKTEGRQPPLRQYVVVSKPCLHQDCPPRQGIIRGEYESVEIIREIPSDEENLTAQKSRSFADLSLDENRHSAMNRSADDLGAPPAIEWLMITRSDPGGSVPRFLIEKGTPPGIVGDASKFLDWVSSTTSRDGTHRSRAIDETNKLNGNTHHDDNTSALQVTQNGSLSADARAQHAKNKGQHAQGTEPGYRDGTPSSTGLYGIMSAAFGVAGSIASGLRSQFSNPLSLNGGDGDGSITSQALSEEDEEEKKEEADATTNSDTTSVQSFASALEKSKSLSRQERASSFNGSFSDGSKSKYPPAVAKDLQKLLDRRQKLERSFTEFQEKMESKRQGDKEKDVNTQAKLREKHDKEVAKHEAKYKREMRKLEEKREQEERKMEARRKKAMERQEKSSLTLELEKVRAEKEVALKQIELLHSQVGELQAQNTLLAAKLGRAVAVNGNEPASPSSSSKAGSVVSKSGKTEGG